MPHYHLRVARPVNDLAHACAMYCKGLGFEVLGSFENHNGFDGVFLGNVGMQYHLEFTFCRAHPVQPSPTQEDLLILYMPDEENWRDACENMIVAGFTEVSPFNSYWSMNGRSFMDNDGYCTVLQKSQWMNKKLESKI